MPTQPTMIAKVLWSPGHHFNMVYKNLLVPGEYFKHGALSCGVLGTLEECCRTFRYIKRHLMLFVLSGF